MIKEEEYILLPKIFKMYDKWNSQLMKDQAFYKESLHKLEKASLV